MLIKTELTATEEAYLAMVQQEHAQTIKAADARRDERLKPLLADKQIPQGVPVNVQARANGEPAYLTYDGPGISPPTGGGTAEEDVRNQPAAATAPEN